ncbi:thiamine pyrophosphate-dependent enzyme [Oleiagrimonas sp. C23AA]|uniref:thiamine pyrophosphate-dependent enzyme n=1 Tax=Oleiagrimonas sp. C23AA TaxID=2719047 RepID=UPI0014211C49|nr:thiamine pyrophosphate-dependent enzyme [Oleiagrimonas sp. C23AA]NII10706.1 ubiquinone-dependent pyruvate dehydrogenase [Oleiagrimonas sp. C23AA]
MSKKKVADIIVDTLAEAGVKRCYGIVGDTLNHITDAIRRSDMEWVHVRHEEAGAMAAGGEAYITGQLTACAGTCGPGSLHFINGLFEAHRNRAPVVLIATQVATAEMGMEFPQEVDLETIYKTCSHFCCTVHSAEQARRVTALAAQTAINKHGVSVIIVPGDISQQETEDKVPFRPHAPAPRVLPSEAELSQMAELLNKADKLAIYCGSGVAGAEDELLALSKKLKIPVAHTSRAKDFVEPNNPNNMGMTGVFGVDSGYHAVSEADTLLLLGADFAWRQFYPDDATLIQVDADPTHLGRRHPVDLGVVGHIKDTLAALLPMVETRESRDFLDECLKHKKATEKSQAKEEHTGDDGLIHPQYLTRLIDQLADEDAVFTADGGSPMVWVLRHTRANGKRRTLPSLVHGTMANAMPSALGIAKALPDRQVIALCGDGGLSMLLGDLLTAVQASIPVKLVVYNNGSLGFVEMEQKVEGLLDSFTELKNPDFGRLAEAVGMYGRRVTEADELEGAVKDWLAHPGPALLDVSVNRMELVMPPKVEFSQVTSTALYGAKAVMAGRPGDVKELLRSNFLD